MTHAFTNASLTDQSNDEFQSNEKSVMREGDDAAALAHSPCLSGSTIITVLFLFAERCI